MSTPPAPRLPRRYRITLTLVLLDDGAAPPTAGQVLAALERSDEYGLERMRSSLFSALGVVDADEAGLGVDGVEVLQ